MANFIILLIWVVSLVRTLLNLAVIRRLRAGVYTSGPFVSVIVPARDEERSIERTVRSLLAQTWESMELIVVNDRSTDSTGRILAAIDDSRLRVINGEEPPPGWLGKPHALHQGALQARGEILLFVDADIQYEPDAVAAAVDHLRRSKARMITLLPHLEMHGFWENVAMPQLTLTAFTFLPTWLSNLTTYPRLGIGGGTGNLVWRDSYERAGGHAALKDAVIDDVGLARLLRRSGLRTEVVRSSTQVSVRMYHGLREIVDGFTKNTFAVFGRNYLVASVLTILGLMVNVWPYIAALTGDVIAIATVGVITLTRLILFAALRYSLLAALFAHPLCMLVWTWIIVRSMWITGVRKRLMWRGRTYDASRTRFGADE